MKKLLLCLLVGAFFGTGIGVSEARQCGRPQKCRKQKTTCVRTTCSLNLQTPCNPSAPVSTPCCDGTALAPAPAIAPAAHVEEAKKPEALSPSAGDKAE